MEAPPLARLPFTLLAVLLAGVLLPTAAGAATFNVTGTADTANALGCTTGPTCSLREAVLAANAEPDSTIVVPAGTYTLNSPGFLGELRITENVTIQGAGADVTTVNANALSRVFAVLGDPETVRISGLTVTGGVTPAVNPPGGYGETAGGDGAGIFSEAANTILTGVAVKGNVSTGLLGSAGGGGGIAVEGFETGPLDLDTLTLESSTVSGNRVEGVAEGEGGGVLVFGNFVATNSTITGNTIDVDGLAQGGGVVNTAADFGGGAFSGITTLLNTTISGNTIEGLDVFGGGFSGDNIGVIFASDLNATNTIIAGNTTGGATEDCALVNTTTTVNNLSSDDSCGFSDAASKRNADPLLGQLRDNGGSTETVLPAATSPAVDTGDAAACPASDQRGVARPQLAGCDIGAVELAPPSALTGGASDVTATSATIGGAASNPHVDAGVAAFEFGTSTAYGQGTPLQSLAAGAQGIGQGAALTGLQPGTTYHYRLDAVNNDGFATGADATFTTLTRTQERRLARPRVALAGIPSRGCVSRAFTVRVNARAASGTRIRSVRVRLDGRVIKRSSRGKFKLRIEAGGLAPGRHKLGIRVTDRRGRSRTASRTFTRCAPVGVPRFTG